MGDAARESIAEKTETFFGIDFSGGSGPWRERVRQPTVWVAEAHQCPRELRLVGLRPVQDLPGPGNGFDRLVKLLGGGAYAAAALDAPFSIPAKHIPKGGHKGLLRLIEETPCAKDRPFPKGSELIAIAESVCPKASMKPLRRCEEYWTGQRVNTRSTLWYKPRGGAPFASACLYLIASTGRPCWPWNKMGDGLLVEAFPAAQLRRWNLPYQGYAGASGAGVRSALVAEIEKRIRVPESLNALMRQSPDALDSVIAIFAAVAVKSGSVAVAAEDSEEGWIAVHD